MGVDCNHWILRQFKPACYTSSVSNAGWPEALLIVNQWSAPPVILTKLEEPQTAVSPLLGLVSVVYWCYSRSGWMSASISTTSETLVVSIQTDMQGGATDCWLPDWRPINRALPPHTHTHSLAYTISVEGWFDVISVITIAYISLAVWHCQ